MVRTIGFSFLTTVVMNSVDTYSHHRKNTRSQKRPLFFIQASKAGRKVPPEWNVTAKEVRYIAPL
jgi:hypothetical protein